MTTPLLEQRRVIRPVGGLEEYPELTDVLPVHLVEERETDGRGRRAHHGGDESGHVTMGLRKGRFGVNVVTWKEQGVVSVFCS